MAPLPVRPTVISSPSTQMAIRNATSARLLVGSASPAPPAGLTVLGLLTCVRRRWKTATALGIVLAGIGATVVWMFLPPAKPYAYTKLHFRPRTSGPAEHPDPPVNRPTQKELVASRMVLQTVVEDPAVAQLSSITEKGDPVGWLIRELEIEFPTESEIMRITLKEDRADEAKIIVDKVALAYMTKIGNEALENRKRFMKELSAKVEAARLDYQSDLDAAKTASAGSEGALSSEVIAQNQRMINNEISVIRTELSKIADQLKVLRADEAVLAARLAKTPVEMSKSEFEPVFAQNPSANRLKQLREDLQTEYDLRLSGLGEMNPTMVALKNRIDGADMQLERLRKELKTTISLQFQDKLIEDVRKKREEISRLASDEKAKLNDIERKQSELERFKVGNTTAAKARPSLTAKGTRFEELVKEHSKLESQMDAPLAVQAIEKEAVIVRPHDASRRMKMSAIAGVVLFGVAFLGIGLLEFRANRLASPGEVSQALGLRLMGTVPARPRNTPLGLGDNEWERVVNEAVDSARTVFLHSAGMQNLRTVMVTSAVGGEGKTSLSASLAASLARSGRRTLLIDADLRNPSVHGHFGLTAGPGVCEILRGEAAASTLIQPTRNANLSILRAGRCDARSIQALAQDEFSRVLAEIGNSGFDFILIDSCPVLPVADALLVARHVDGVLLSLLVDYSQVDRVNAACQKLASIEVPLLGAVVNGTRDDAYGYGYGYSPDYRAQALTT